VAGGDERAPLMHVFHQWSKWTDIHKIEITAGDAVLALIDSPNQKYKPAVVRIDLRQERRCSVCGAAQYRKTSA
jgi:hypothetical protein